MVLSVKELAARSLTAAVTDVGVGAGGLETCLRCASAVCWQIEENT